MIKHLFSLAGALALAAPVSAQEEPQSKPSPNEIIARAGADEWVAIDPEDLLVMTLAPDAEGNERKVIIQLMPAPFSVNWTANIRTFARAGWYDDITVNRVQDNYVVQWGDANYDNPEASGEPKVLPQGLSRPKEWEYFLTTFRLSAHTEEFDAVAEEMRLVRMLETGLLNGDPKMVRTDLGEDPYAAWNKIIRSWPLASDLDQIWPVHCYGMIGVGRNLSPDAGTGAELYTVIGHAPRHLDRNIALVGRIVEGIEHLSSLPRGKGVLGFYEDESKRTPILTVRVASDLPDAERPMFEYLSTEGETFARYAEARANRRDPFFNVPAGGADICNIPVPIRRVAE